MGFSLAVILVILRLLCPKGTWAEDASPRGILSQDHFGRRGIGIAGTFHKLNRHGYALSQIAQVGWKWEQAGIQVALPVQETLDRPSLCSGLAGTELGLEGQCRAAGAEQNGVSIGNLGIEPTVSHQLKLSTGPILFVGAGLGIYQFTGGSRIHESAVVMPWMSSYFPIGTVIQPGASIGIGSVGPFRFVTSLDYSIGRGWRKGYYIPDTLLTHYSSLPERTTKSQTFWVSSLAGAALPLGASLFMEFVGARQEIETVDRHLAVVSADDFVVENALPPEIFPTSFPTTTERRTHYSLMPGIRFDLQFYSVALGIPVALGDGEYRKWMKMQFALAFSYNL